MKILQVFNQYRFRGGEEAWVDGIGRLLGSRAIVEELRFRTDDWLLPSGPSPIKQVFLMANNPASRAELRSNVARFKPDVLLFHNVIPVGSFGLYEEARLLGIPVLQYTHNFRPFSPGGTLWTGNAVDDAGLHGNPWPEIMSGAWQDSRIKTAILAFHLKRAISNGLLDCIDRWIAPSAFMRDKFIETGIPTEKCLLLRHCWDATKIPPPTGEGSHYLFLGRLVTEKGVRNLVGAWELLERELGANCPELVIAGTGPDEEILRTHASHLASVKFVGFVSGKQKEYLVRSCRALLVPSIWWEPLGLTAYEAYAAGRPVIAARSGALMETVTDGVTGWSHIPGDARDLARAIVASETAGADERNNRGSAGRNWLLENANPSVWRDQFIGICQSVARISRKAESKDFATARGAAIPKTAPRDVSESQIVPDSPDGTNGIVRVETMDSSFSSQALSSAEPDTNELRISAYLADQNPGYDRSFGISRMSQVVLDALKAHAGVRIEAITSRTSQSAPASVDTVRVLPWGTRRKWVRLATDHLHPLFKQGGDTPDIHYFPKGYLPLLGAWCRPSVVTIHDTIIQYDEDHYPNWRNAWEYRYWAMMLKHTLHSADRILTVSESSKRQIQDFMDRHRIPRKEITVTYEPCLYENIPQPDDPPKENYVIHLASCEPHKRTAHLVRWWHEAESDGRELPMLHLIGSVPTEVQLLLASSRSIVRRPFLEDAALQDAYQKARALVLPSEIEGFGLPALEAYYLGTPVCFVKGTSVEEVLSVATNKGGFSLESSESLFTALRETLAMSPEEVRDCGLKLREIYAAEKIAERILTVFREVAGQG